MPLSPPVAKARYRFAPVPAVTLLSLACALFTACGGGSSPSGGDAPAPPPASAPAPQPVAAAADGLALVAGDVDGPGNLDGMGPQARFHVPSKLVVDAQGHVYVVDDRGHTLRKIEPSGEVSTVPAFKAGYRDDENPGDAAWWGSLGRIVAAPQGGLFAWQDGGLRKLSPSGEVGDATPPLHFPPTDRGLSPSAWVMDGQGRIFSLRETLAASPLMSIYVDRYEVVRLQVAQDGAVTLHSVPGGSGGRGDTLSLATDPAGAVHLAWKNAGTAEVQLFKLDAAGTFQPASPKVDVPEVAMFGLPTTHAVDAQGNAYLNPPLDWTGNGGEAGRPGFIKVTPAGAVQLIGAKKGRGVQDGPLSSAKFGEVESIAADAAGNLYIADSWFGNIRKIDPQGLVSTLAGPSAGGSIGRMATAAALAGGRVAGGLSDLAVSPSGRDLYLHFGLYGVRNPADDGPVPTTGEDFTAWASTHANQLFRLKSGGGSTFDSAFRVPVEWPRVQTDRPMRMGMDRDGNLYFAGRKYSPDGQPLPLASEQTFRYHDIAKVNYLPNQMAVDRLGVVTSSYGRALVRWRPGPAAPDFQVQAGDMNASPLFAAYDGFQAQAVIAGAAGLATDTAGNVYFADSSSPGAGTRHGMVRKMSPQGEVTSLAGTSIHIGSADGQGGAARFRDPSDVAMDSAGNVYVADSGNYTVRKVTPDGKASTVVGQPGRRGIRLGPLPGALDTPTAIDIDADDTLYIATPGAVLKVKLPK